jgi:hypothetical protein
MEFTIMLVGLGLMYVLGSGLEEIANAIRDHK